LQPLETLCCRFCFQRGVVLALLSAVWPVDAQVLLPSPQGAAFPLMMYEASPADARNLNPYGWNVLQSYGLNTTSDINSYLQGLATNKLTGVAVIPAMLTTNATNSNSTTALAGGQFQFAATNSGVASFTMLVSANLSAWSAFASATRSVSGLYQFTDTLSAQTPLRFYRAR
jgi:hypothetical protein